MPNLNKVLRHMVAPPARLLFPARVIGLENLPSKGPFVIVAGPHRTELESILLACALLDWELHFFAKKEYWEGKAWLRWFMDGTGMIPLDRLNSRFALQQVNRGVEVVREGGIVAMYAEGTRSGIGDECVHKGHTGAARISLRTGAPIVPMGYIGMRNLNPPNKKLPRPGRCTIVIGEPIYPHLFKTGEHHLPLTGVMKKVAEGDLPLLADAAAASTLARPLTDHVMAEIARLSNSPYDNTYLKIGASASKQ